jgi:hypothetical protein
MLICISMPFWQAICLLQNTCLSLMLLCGVVWRWRSAARGKGFMAGLLCGLLLYKPQIACLIAGALFVTLGWRALVGFAVTTSALLGLTIWKLPGAMDSYILMLPRLVQEIQQRPQYNWGRQPTAMGFWRLLLQGHAGGPAQTMVTILCGVTIGLVAIGWAAALWHSRRQLFSKLDRFMAATILCMPLLMPYFMDYDLLLLAIPAVLLAKERLESNQLARGADRLLPWAWTALFLVLYVNPGLSGALRVNLATPLVALVAGLMILRCIRVDCSDQAAEGSQPRRLAMAA